MEILGVVTDLFYRSRLIELAHEANCEIRFVNNEKLDEHGFPVLFNPDLIVLDLSDTDFDPFSIAQNLRKKWPHVKLFGVYPHVRKDLKSKATILNFYHIVPNSSFLSTLRQVLSEGKTC